jgi:Tfp pilus assembly protein PilO
MEIILLLISLVSIMGLTFYLLSVLSTIENNRFIEELMKEDEKKFGKIK